MYEASPVTSQSTQAQSRYVEANGQRLHYRRWSADGPPLIFLHGVTSSATSWDEIAPEFAADFSVMAFDLRGHGLSSKPTEGYSWADHYAADIADFLRSHVNEPAVLVGHSLGAVVTAPVAAGVPDRVRCIVLEDPPAFAPSEDHARTLDRFRPVLALKRMAYEVRLARLVDAMNGDQRAAQRRADSLEAMAEQVLVELLAGDNAYRPDDWFPRVSCPSLVILGNTEKGAVVRGEDRPRLTSLLRDSRLVEWDDVGHGIHTEQPQRFVAEVRAFLDSLGTGTALS